MSYKYCNIYIKMHTAKGEESNQNNNTVMKRFLSVLPIFAIFIAVVKGIYPNDHFKYSTKLTEENVDLFVKSNVVVATILQQLCQHSIFVLHFLPPNLFFRTFLLFHHNPGMVLHYV